MSKLSGQRPHRCSRLFDVDQMKGMSTSESSSRYINVDETGLYPVLLEKREES
jgi:hypothetical protein